MHRFRSSILVLSTAFVLSGLTIPLPSPAAGLSGAWHLSQTVSKSCASGMVSFSFSAVEITDDDPSVSVDAGMTPPGTMTGSFAGAGSFTAQNVIAGTCTEAYTFAATAVTQTELEATFSADYSGFCLDCTNSSWNLTATREIEQVPAISAWGYGGLAGIMFCWGLLFARGRHRRAGGNGQTA